MSPPKMDCLHAKCMPMQNDPGYHRVRPCTKASRWVPWAGQHPWRGQRRSEQVGCFPFVIWQFLWSCLLFLQLSHALLFG